MIVFFATVLTIFVRPYVARADTSSQPNTSAQPLNGPFQLFPLTKARYYFQSNVGGNAKAEYRVTFGRNDGHRNQFNINIPVVTSYSNVQAPKTGLGNISLYVGHVNLGESFNHTLAGELRLPTATNRVRSNDTQIRPRYDVRWFSPNSSLTIENTFAQSIIVPPGSQWTSYYDVKAAAAPLTRQSTFAVFYEGRVLFNKGGTYASAIGPSFVAQEWGRARLSLYDIWGIGASGQSNLWRYKFQANLTAKI